MTAPHNGRMAISLPSPSALVDRAFSAAFSAAGRAVGTASTLAAVPGRLLRLVDEKGRKFIIRAAQIAYVEIAPEDGRKVGFAIG